MMKIKNIFLLAMVLVMPFMMTSCQAIGDIFKAGVWAGLIGVVLVVVLLAVILRKLF